jgi:hypothetical protein
MSSLFLAIGDTIQDYESGATATVAGIAGNVVMISNVTGTFAVNDDLVFANPNANTLENYSLGTAVSATTPFPTNLVDPVAQTTLVKFADVNSNVIFATMTLSSLTTVQSTATLSNFVPAPPVSIPAYTIFIFVPMG